MVCRLTWCYSVNDVVQDQVSKVVRRCQVLGCVSDERVDVVPAVASIATVPTLINIDVLRSNGMLVSVTTECAYIVPTTLTECSYEFAAVR